MHSGSAQKLAELARSKGYEVQFEYGSFPCDIKMNEGLDCYSRMANHSIRSAAAYIQGHPGID
jgi:hypothetical protein